MKDQVDISDLLTPQAKKVNEQLYPGSGLSRSAVAKEYAEHPHRLHDDLAPNLSIKHEQPEHRMMVILKAQGTSNDDIARQFGYTNTWVSQVLRQPWARKYLVELLERSGVEAVQGALQTAALDSVFKLIDLRDDATSPKNVQANCAMNILDRILGKPTQRIESTTTVNHVPTDMAEIDNELAVLQAEEKRLGLIKQN